VKVRILPGAVVDGGAVAATVQSTAPPHTDIDGGVTVLRHMPNTNGVQ
jgi:hypothetical protein